MIWLKLIFETILHHSRDLLRARNRKSFNAISLVSCVLEWKIEMKTYFIRPEDLDASLTARWKSIRQCSAYYQSPFYHPRFSQIMGKARSDTYIAVFEVDGEIAGFLPFHKSGAMIGHPIGYFLSDYQGPIIAADCELTGRDMLNAMQVKCFPFNHVPLEKSEFMPYAWKNSRSTLIDVSAGYDAYKHILAELHGGTEAKIFKEVRRKERMTLRECGGIHFEMKSRDSMAFHTMLKGKSDQLIRTLGRRRDWLALPWVNQVLNEVFHETDEDFGGMFSALYAGDQLVAAQFGLRSGSIMHGWLLWYRIEHASFSPGIVLMNRLAQGANSHGIRQIDMGRGEQPFKLRFANGQVDLVEGVVVEPAAVWRAAGALHSARCRLKNSFVGSAWKKSRKLFQMK
jgi:CelD/BcsL family acetyltransferase involved in cellulose biosynthesis